MEEDQEQNKCYVCKFCEHTFSNGRKLGGHMRGHLALISSSKKKSIEEHDQESINGVMGIAFDEEIIKNSEDSGANSYGLRENPKKSWRVSNSNSKQRKISDLICKKCGKVFHSLRALSSHMRSHSLKSKVSVKKNLCTECGKSFDSVKALYGHMRCHTMKKSQPSISNQSSYPSSSSSEDGKLDGGVKEEMKNPVKRKRSCTMYKSTSLRPFKLRTEQRGRSKQEEFMKKVHEMLDEQQKQRIPIAQGLPFTTDEPECLVKPAVKESTRPIDVVLHSDVRAVERAEFDNHVQEKLSLIEEYKLERERLQKVEEEEELRRLRKELVPKAQPMPYFDRPFIPRRSEKAPTIPKEPKFHDHPHHKKIKCCMSWTDMMHQR